MTRTRATREFFALLLLWLGTVLSLTPAQAASSANAWLLVPGVRAGPITATASVADLIRLFGKANVREKDVRFSEAEARPGAVIYPSDPIRRAEIVWKDPTRKRFPDVFVVAADPYVPANQTYKSVWHTAQGITLGTTIQEVERLNGRPFLMYPFDRDGQGVVSSWRGGRMEKPLENLMVKFHPTHPDPMKAASKAELDSMSGPLGTLVRSDYPVFRKLMLRVFLMAMSF